MTPHRSQATDKTEENVRIAEENNFIPFLNYEYKCADIQYLRKSAHSIRIPSDSLVLCCPLPPSVNSTSGLGPVELVTIPANKTSVTLVNLKSSTLYKFYFYATTIKGSGPSIMQEAFTIMDTGMFALSAPSVWGSNGN